MVCILLPDTTTVPTPSIKAATPKNVKSLSSTTNTANGKNVKPFKSHSASYKLAKKSLNEGMKENLALDKSLSSVVEIISNPVYQVKPTIDMLPQTTPIKNKKKKKKNIKGQQEKEDSSAVHQIATSSIDKDVKLAVESTKLVYD